MSIASLPWSRMLCEANFDSIDSQVGNPNYPGPAVVLSVFAFGGRVWASTMLPIWVFEVMDGDAVLSPFGADRDVQSVGDRGEFYSWVERVPGEVWGGCYSGTDRVVRFLPSRAGYSYDGEGLEVSRGWRPRGSCTDGTNTYWGVGPVSSSSGEYGAILAVDSDGVGTKYASLFAQDIFAMAYDATNDKIIALASGEGIEGATVGGHFHQIEPTTMTVDFSVQLGGSRGLSLYQLNDDRWAVVSHLASTTEARLQVVNTDTQTREWVRKFDGSGDDGSGLPVPIFGRSRDSLVSLDSRLWVLGDDHVYEVDVDGQNLVPRCNVSRTATNSGTPQITNMVASSEHGLVWGLGNRVWAWDPR